MSYYLIEFRFQGKARSDLKRMTYEVKNKFNLEKKEKPVPHITIVAPFTTRNQKRLVQDFKQICLKHPLIRFNLSGFGTFQKSKVVYVNIIPSHEMINFRKDLINRLKPYCILKSNDINYILGIFKRIRKYFPHVTIAMELDENKFEMIKNYVDKKEKPFMRYTLARVTLIKDKIILYEYDFLLKRLLNRREAKSKEIYYQTIERLKSLKE